MRGISMTQQQLQSQSFSSAEQRENEASVESLVWSCTWAQAFPTLLAKEIYVEENEPAWQLLAFSTIFGETRGGVDNTKSNWKHKRDETDMAGSLGYGEITTHAVTKIMQCISNFEGEQQQKQEPENDSMVSLHLRNKKESIVVDLGSGNAQVLMTACLAHPFSKAVGLEIVPALHDEAVMNFHLWKLQNPFCDDKNTETTFDLRCTDFTKDHSSIIASADLIFVHATVFSDMLMRQVQRLCQACPNGTYFVMVTKPLKEVCGIRTHFLLPLDMSWGQATVYIQQKVS